MTRLEKCELAVKLGFTYNELNGDVITPTLKIVHKVTKNGYLLMTFRDFQKKTQNLYAHQFAYYVKNAKIVDYIDHIDRNKTNNRASNLRSVTKSQNAMNMSNVKGYTYCSRSKKYIAIIMVNYKKKHLGVFETKEEARKCYLENKEKYHTIN